jgi:PBP1b-binding outer membrane lipoprotein LpoB
MTRTRTHLLTAAAALLLGGCVTVQDAKTQIVPPSPTATAVTAKAIAKCQDLFFVVSCTLQVWLESDPPRWKLEQAPQQGQAWPPPATAEQR